MLPPEPQLNPVRWETQLWGETGDFLYIKVLEQGLHAHSGYPRGPAVGGPGSVGRLDLSVEAFDVT